MIRSILNVNEGLKYKLDDTTEENMDKPVCKLIGTNRCPKCDGKLLRHEHAGLLHAYAADLKRCQSKSYVEVE